MFFLDHVSDRWVQKIEEGGIYFDNFGCETSIILPCEKRLLNRRTGKGSLKNSNRRILVPNYFNFHVILSWIAPTCSTRVVYCKAFVFLLIYKYKKQGKIAAVPYC